MKYHHIVRLRAAICAAEQEDHVRLEAFAFVNCHDLHSIALALQALQVAVRAARECALGDIVLE